VATIKANSDPAYLQLRQIARTETDFGGPFATVNNLVLKRDRLFSQTRRDLWPVGSQRRRQIYDHADDCLPDAADFRSTYD